MTTRAKFKGIAAKLFAKFSDLAPNTPFVTPGMNGTFNPVTGTVTGGTDALIEYGATIREEYEARQIDGQAIQANDFKLLVQVDSFTQFDPRADNTFTFVDNIPCRIINATKDAADAVWTVQCRTGGVPDEYVIAVYDMLGSDMQQGLLDVDTTVNVELP